MLALLYLFDPLCGWCYGAAPALRALADHPDLMVRPLPTGQFAGSGARPIDEAFADHAWANDQRIFDLTGQPFSRAYREQVLTRRDRFLDSGPATLALTAVHLQDPRRELEALALLQAARYVEGQDITDPDWLEVRLAKAGFASAAQWLRMPDAALHHAAARRIAEAQKIARQLGTSGVPVLAIDRPGGPPQLVPAELLFGKPAALVAALVAARAAIR